jgi:hypothetical protein
MGRALAQLGASLKAARPTVGCPWPDWKRRRRLHALRSKVGRDWCLPGQRRLVMTPGNNKKRYLAGALDARTRKLVWVEGKSKASSGDGQ